MRRICIHSSALHGYSGMLKLCKKNKQNNDEKYKLLKYVEHVVWKEIF